MKKISTVQASRARIFADRSSRSVWIWEIAGSCYCVLDEAGEIVLEQKVATTPEAMKRRFRRDTAESDRAGDRNTFALGQPAVNRVGTRSDRGACAKGAIDHREQSKRRSTRCADAGTAGADRSGVVGAGAASQCASANPSDGDPGASGTGECSNGLGERGTRIGEVLWRTAARVQRTQHGCRESRGS